MTREDDLLQEIKELRERVDFERCVAEMERNTSEQLREEYLRVCRERDSLKISLDKSKGAPQ